jgi:hypothetical protein
VDHFHRGYLIERCRIVRAVRWQVRAPSGRIIVYVCRTLAEARNHVDSYLREPWPDPFGNPPDPADLRCAAIAHTP